MSFTIDSAAALVTANLAADRDLYLAQAEGVDVEQLANELMVIVYGVVHLAAQQAGEEPLDWWRTYLMLPWIRARAGD